MNINTKNLWIVSMSGAVLSLVISNLPYLGFVNCLLCGGFWGSAIFAVWLYKRLSGNLSIRQGVNIGALTGLLAGLVGFALSFVGLAGAQGILNSARQFLPADAIEPRFWVYCRTHSECHQDVQRMTDPQQLLSTLATLLSM